MSKRPTSDALRPKGARGGKESRTGGRTEKQSKAAERPGWANGLRQLYDSVVEEPLPDNFKDLLSKLDRNP